MIKAFIIINTSGKPRLLKFYEYKSTEQQQDIIKNLHRILSKRTSSMCNFVDLGKEWDDSKLIYKQFATLYAAVIADTSESELAMLDIIQTFVETLDKCFKNVCELDLVFHFDQVQMVLDELIIGGLVAETKTDDILDVYKLKTGIVSKENFWNVSSLKSDILTVSESLNLKTSKS